MYPQSLEQWAVFFSYV